MAKKEKYVRYQTITNATKGGLPSSGQSKVLRVGSNKVLLSRAEKLDKYGNPVYTASLIKNNGNVESSSKVVGNAELAIERALNKGGIDTKRPNRTYKKSY